MKTRQPKIGDLILYKIGVYGIITEKVKRPFRDNFSYIVVWPDEDWADRAPSEESNLITDYPWSVKLHCWVFKHRNENY